jgi:hypothetical protein
VFQNKKMLSNISKSLHVAKINKYYTEDMIKFLFWKFGVGKVDRVDFESIDNTFQEAFIYMDKECSELNFKYLHYNEKDGSYSIHPYRVLHNKVNVV